jgi:WD40 repeat protein
VLFENPRKLPFGTIEHLSRRDGVAVGDSQGVVWEVSFKGAPRQIRPADHNEITVLRASLDGTLLAVGTNTGVVTIYETTRYDVVQEITLEAGIHQIQFDPHNRDLLVVSKDGQIRAVTLSALPRVQWATLAMEVQNAAYSKDGETIAIVCRDGASWFYSFPARRWVYTRDHLTDTPWGLFSDDGAHFASTDGNGVVVVRDMARTFNR